MSVRCCIKSAHSATHSLLPAHGPTRLKQLFNVSETKNVFRDVFGDAACLYSDEHAVFFLASSSRDFSSSLWIHRYRLL